MSNYPQTPGWRREGTSHEAADAMAGSAPNIRAAVHARLKQRAMTVHECAAAMEVTVPAVQPRFSELARIGRIRDTGERRVNAVSGKRAIVWEAVPDA